MVTLFITPVTKSHDPLSKLKLTHAPRAGPMSALCRICDTFVMRKSLDVLRFAALTCRSAIGEAQASTTDEGL